MWINAALLVSKCTNHLWFMVFQHPFENTFVKKKECRFVIIISCYRKYIFTCMKILFCLAQTSVVSVANPVGSMQQFCVLLVIVFLKCFFILQINRC